MERQNADLTWLKASCPICESEYEYTIFYMPETCGKMSCLFENEANKIEERKK